MTTNTVTDHLQATCQASQSCGTEKSTNQVGVMLAWILAAAFAGATIVGFVPNPLIGQASLFMTNTAHNLVHLLTAVGFAVVALIGNRASTRFMLAFGPIYVLVGLIGFIALGSAPEGRLLGIIHINFMDNFLHVGLGIVIGAAGLFALSKTERPIVQTQT